MNEKRTENILEVEEVIMAFGGLMALINLDFQVQHTHQGHYRPQWCRENHVV